MHRHLVSLIALLLAGCASAPIYRAATPAQTIRADIPTLNGSSHQVQPGETLWRIARSYGLDAKTLAAANQLPAAGHIAVGEKLFIPLPRETTQFLWPVRGSFSHASPGLEIAAPSGSLVRASRSGRVAVATRQLSGWGKTVVLDHLDGYLSIYAGLDQVLAAPGATLKQGIPLGVVGERALHFEIRYGSAPKNTLALLPEE